MKNPEWPGIATAAALIFVATMIIAIYRDPDGFKLKDWQTLIAAFVALGAAVFAFIGAMAKVNLDRQHKGEDLNRIRMGVFLRLQTSLLMVRRNARSAIAEIDNRSKSLTGARIDDLGPPPGIDLDDAWENLHLFPQPIAYKIANIRLNLLGLASATEERPVIIVPDHVREVRKMLERVDVYAGEVLGWMSPDLADKTA